MTDAGSAPLTVDWGELARQMGLTDADEALQLFINLVWREDFWIVRRSAREN